MWWRSVLNLISEKSSYASHLACRMGRHIAIAMSLSHHWLGKRDQSQGQIRPVTNSKRFVVTVESKTRHGQNLKVTWFKLQIMFSVSSTPTSLASAFRCRCTAQNFKLSDWMLDCMLKFTLGVVVKVYLEVFYVHKLIPSTLCQRTRYFLTQFLILCSKCSKSHW